MINTAQTDLITEALLTVGVKIAQNKSTISNCTSIIEVHRNLDGIVLVLDKELDSLDDIKLLEQWLNSAIGTYAGFVDMETYRLSYDSGQKGENILILSKVLNTQRLFKVYFDQNLFNSIISKTS